MIGPDGTAYASRIRGLEDGVVDGTERTIVNVLDERGLRSGGWPLSMPAGGSDPGFDTHGHVMISQGSPTRGGVRVRAFDAGDATGAAVSPRLAFPALEWLGEDCIVGSPERPETAPDGSTYVFSQVDPRIYALDESLEPLRGWPYSIPGSFEHPGISEGGLDCFGPVPPVASPRGGIYLSLSARTARVGGRIVLVGPGGRVGAGWPVQLRSPGAAFWQLTVGADGVAYALAIESETANRWSATVLAIAPNGSIRYRTALLEP